MNRGDIYFMAKQVGIDSVEQYDSDTSPLELLEAFAKLVAQHEREACANLFDERDKDIGWYDPGEPAEIIRARNK